MYAVRHHLAIIGFDPYVNFPEGARIYWPQGFDLMLAAISRAVTDGTQAAVERASAIAIPVLGLLAIGAVYAFARVSLGPHREEEQSGPGAGVAALAFAVIPLTVDYSMLGYVDHHVMEPFFVAVAAACLLAGFARTGTRAVIAGAAAGFSAAIACWFVTVGLAIVILVCTLATWEAVRARLPGARPAGLAAVCAAALTLLALVAAQGEAAAGTSYLMLSAFHARLAVAGAALAAASVLAAWRGLPRAWRAFGSLASLVVAAVAIAQGGYGIGAQIGDALGFLTRSEGFASQIRESEPLWRQGWTDFLLALTPLGILAPFVLGFAILRDPAGTRRPAALLSLALLAMGLTQIRFMPLGSVGIAWAAGWLGARVWRGAARVRGRVWIRGLAIAAIAAACAAPKLFDLDPVERLAPHQDDLDLAAVFGQTLRDPSFDPDALDRRPAWGVIAPWRVGHYLVYRGGVPVVAAPFGQAPWHLEGVRRMVRFNLAESDEAAVDLCRRLRVRYAVTSDPVRAIFNDTRVLGIPTDRYARLTPGPGGQAGVWITPDYLRTAGFRLHLLDGRAVTIPGIELPAMASFRLVWESRGTLDARIGSVGPLQIGQPAYYKVFERVAGARVSGRCAPGEPVRLETSVQTNTGRILEWSNVAECAGGAYALRTPYASESHVVQGDRDRAIAITEDQVREGGEVRADVAGPGA